MTLPSIQLNASARPDEAVALLRELATNSYSEGQPSGATHPVDKRDAYVNWATRTEGRLRTILSTAEAADLFNDPRHRDICSMAPGGQLLPLISAEIDLLAHRLATLADELDLARRLFEGAGTCLVPDTSFFIEHEEKLEYVDFHRLAHDPGRVRVVVPMVVVDELDGLKKGSSPKTRWRAGYSLAVIDRLVTDPPWAGVLTAGTHLPPRGDVTIQIVLDPRGHERMSINDDELVARCLACSPFARHLTVVTYDTGRSTRARAAGITVRKLSHDIGQEPARDS